MRSMQYHTSRSDLLVDLDHRLLQRNSIERHCLPREIPWAESQVGLHVCPGTAGSLARRPEDSGMVRIDLDETEWCENCHRSTFHRWEHQRPSSFIKSLALLRGTRGHQAVKDYQRDITSLYTRAIIGTLNSLRKNVGMPLITERELEKLPSGRRRRPDAQVVIG